VFHSFAILYIFCGFFRLDFCADELTSLHFIVSCVAGFYHPTILKVHSSFWITAHATMQGLLELKINFFWWYMKNSLLIRGIRTQDLSVFVLCFNHKTTATHSPYTYMGSLSEPTFSSFEICPRGKCSNTTETNYFIFVVFLC
jgi:hypothetical protein